MLDVHRSPKHSKPPSDQMAGQIRMKQGFGFWNINGKGLRH
jgi:hypothetical protein